MIVAGSRQVVPDHRPHFAGVGSEDDDPVGHESDFFDVVADHEERRDVALLTRPDVEDFRA